MPEPTSLSSPSLKVIARRGGSGDAGRVLLAGGKWLTNYEYRALREKVENKMLMAQFDIPATVRAVIGAPQPKPKAPLPAAHQRARVRPRARVQPERNSKSQSISYAIPGPDDLETPSGHVDLDDSAHSLLSFHNDKENSSLDDDTFPPLSSPISLRGQTPFDDDVHGVDLDAADFEDRSPLLNEVPASSPAPTAIPNPSAPLGLTPPSQREGEQDNTTTPTCGGNPTLSNVGEDEQSPDRSPPRSLSAVGDDDQPPVLNAPSSTGTSAPIRNGSSGAAPPPFLNGELERSAAQSQDLDPSLPNAERAKQSAALSSLAPTQLAAETPTSIAAPQGAGLASVPQPSTIPPTTHITPPRSPDNNDEESAMSPCERAKQRAKAASHPSDALVQEAAAVQRSLASPLSDITVSTATATNRPKVNVKKIDPQTVPEAIEKLFVYLTEALSGLDESELLVDWLALECESENENSPAALKLPAAKRPKVISGLLRSKVQMFDSPPSFAVEVLSSELRMWWISLMPTWRLHGKRVDEEGVWPLSRRLPATEVETWRKVRKVGPQGVVLVLYGLALWRSATVSGGPYHQEYVSMMEDVAWVMSDMVKNYVPFTQRDRVARVAPVTAAAPEPPVIPGAPDQPLRTSSGRESRPSTKRRLALSDEGASKSKRTRKARN